MSNLRMFDDNDHHHHQFQHLIIGSTTSSSLNPFPPLSNFRVLHGLEDQLHHHDHQSVPDTSKSNNISTDQVKQQQQLELECYSSMISTTTNTSLGSHDDHHRETTTLISSMDHHPAWSNDELLALLKLRSSLDICFLNFTHWEHLSRKLGELGFKRSAEQCKAKFEEESRYFNTTTVTSYNKISSNNYRNIFSELDELYPAHDREDVEKQNKEEQIKDDKVADRNEHPSYKICEEVVVKKPPVINSSSNIVSKKRKRRSSDKFEKFKSFCEDIVTRMISEQEELHKKLIKEIVKRDEEKMARDEAWRNEEMDRVKREIEIIEKEQKSAGERQATIIEFLKKFKQDDDHNTTPCNVISQNKVEETMSTSVVSSMIHPSSFQSHQNDDLLRIDHTKTVPSSSPPMSPSNSNTGKRWPRDEVLALINLRCKLCTNSDESKEGAVKGPLWERISQGMSDMGYKRSAKRCKEKWENINKYFRKTKDSNKKRSIDSRTCPYFHQLSSLYRSTSAPTDVQEI